MARGLKTGGRRRGTPNKVALKTREALWAYVEKAAEQDPMAHPIHFLTSIMTSPTTSTADRLTAALALLDRMFPKLKAVEHDLGAQTLYVTVLQYEQRLTQALEQANLTRQRNGHPAAALNVEPQQYGGTV